MAAPLDYHEIAQGCWATTLLARAALTDPKMIDMYAGNMEAGVVVTSSYSGVGSDAVACSMLEHAAKQQGLVYGDSQADGCRAVSVYAACDIDPTCQALLANHGGCFAPQHVYGDLCCMVPPQDIMHLRHRQDWHRAAALGSDDYVTTIVANRARRMQLEPPLGGLGAAPFST